MKFVLIIIHKGISAHAPNESLLTKCIALTTLPNFMQHKNSNCFFLIFNSQSVMSVTLYVVSVTQHFN